MLRYEVRYGALLGGALQHGAVWSNDSFILVFTWTVCPSVSLSVCQLCVWHKRMPTVWPMAARLWYWAHGNLPMPNNVVQCGGVMVRVDRMFTWTVCLSGMPL